VGGTSLRTPRAPAPRDGEQLLPEQPSVHGLSGCDQDVALLQCSTAACTIQVGARHPQRWCRGAADVVPSPWMGRMPRTEEPVRQIAASRGDANPASVLMSASRVSAHDICPVTWRPTAHESSAMRSLADQRVGGRPTLGKGLGARRSSVTLCGGPPDLF